MITWQPKPNLGFQELLFSPTSRPTYSMSALNFVPATSGMFVGELGEKLLAGTPLGRFGEPEEIAPVAVFLASQDSHWVTGESLRAAGGVRGVGY